MLRKHTIVLFLILCYCLRAQEVGSPLKGNTDIFGTRVFIENKGQFNKCLPSGKKIEFTLDHGSEKIFFTENGLVYEFSKTPVLTERQREEIEEGRLLMKDVIKKYYVYVTWLGCNTNIDLKPGEDQKRYFTYGSKELNAFTYKKITYENVYNHIDVVFTIPNDKRTGIKYSLILHPGARPEEIKIAYSGDVKHLELDKEGNVIIKTKLITLKELAPISYYSDHDTIASSFTLDKKVIGFNFPNSFDSNRTLVVDPWVGAITTLTNNNCGYDVDFDNSGNLYVYGGSPPAKVAKYSSTGSLIWTFSGVIISPIYWYSDGQLSWIGNFVVEKSSGKTFVGACSTGGATIIRLNASGNYDNLKSPGVQSWTEIWDMAYHCSTGNIYGMGGSTTSKQSAGILNQSTGIVTPVAFLGYGTVAHDIVSHAIDDAGEVYWLYASVGSTVINNTIAKINSAFTSSVWIVPSGYTSMVEIQNKSLYTTPSYGSNGFNCLAVNNNYLFYYNGFNLAAYNKLNGAVLASIITSGGLTLKQRGGIAVDDCNNLYLGSAGTIECYNFNGSTFQPLAPIPVGTSSISNQAVFDIQLDKANKTLYVAGNGFVGTYSAIPTVTCPLGSVVCVIAQPNRVICAGTNVIMNLANYPGLTNLSYALQPGNLSSSTGIFTVNPNVTTTYTSFVTGTTSGSVVITLTTVSTVSVNPQPITAPSLTQTTCTSTLNGFNLNLSFNPPGPVPGYTVAWSTIPNGIFSYTQTSASGGINPGAYTATITTATGCYTVTSFTINPQPEPSVFSMSPPGGSYQIDCYQPVLNLTFTPAAYNYTSTNGVALPIVGPNAAFSSTNSFGTWTVTGVNPNSGCISKQTFVIVTNTAIPTSTLTPLLQNINCSVTTVMGFTAFASPTVNITHQWMTPQGGTVAMTVNPAVLIPGGPGSYTHCVLNNSNGCSTCKTMTVFSSSGYPTYSVNSPQSFTLGCGTKSVATINISGGATTPVPGGPISYTIVGPPTSTNYVTGSNSTYTVNTPGTWTVITKDNTSFCETKAQVSVIQNTFAPDISAIVPYQVLTCDQPSVVLQGVSLTPNIDYNWSFPGVPGNFPSSTVAINANFANTTNTLVANYTLTITDNSSTCKSTTVVTMLQNIVAPNALISGGTQLTCSTPSINFTNSSSTRIPPYFSPTAPVIGYMWSGPSPQIPLQVSSTYIGWAPGNYTMVAKDLNNGCTAVATKSLDDFRDYPVINNPIAPAPSVLDCGAKTATLIPIITTPTAGLTYTWTGPPTASMSDQYAMIQYPNEIGLYLITVYNPANGCSSEAIMTVVNGALKADFTVDQSEGYAPLEVLFTNKSGSTNGNSNVTSIWSFGNGTSQITYSSTVSPKTIYKQPGTYTVTMHAVKGTCIDTVQKIIKVEIASELVIPNVFSPNNDNVNDVFFVKATNLSEIHIIIVDRWGHKVYELTSTTGNIAWDGKNQTGQDVAEGVYSCVLTAKGKDGSDYNKKGTITLVR